MEAPPPEDPQGLPVQGGPLGRRWRAQEGVLQGAVRVPEARRLVPPVEGRGVVGGRGGRADLRDGQRGGEQDAELSVEGPHHGAAEQGDQVPVQVGVCPGETGEDIYLYIYISHEDHQET